MSVGIIDPRANPTQLNTVEFLWDPSKRTSVFIQVLFLSFTFSDVFFFSHCHTNKHEEIITWKETFTKHKTFLCFKDKFVLLSQFLFAFFYICRSTVSAQNSLCGSTEEKKVYRSASRLTLLRRTRMKSTQNTFTLLPVRSKSSRWSMTGNMNIMNYWGFMLFALNNPAMMWWDSA